MNKFILTFLIILLGVIFFDSSIPLFAKEVIYSIGLSVKSIIIFLLPLIIFGLILKTTVRLSSGATKIISFIIVLVCLSNFCATFLSHFIGEKVYELPLSLISPEASQTLNPIWVLKLPSLISNDIVLFSALIYGILISQFFNSQAKKIAQAFETLTNLILKMVIRFIPFFILGCVIKIRHDGTLLHIFKDYIQIFIIIGMSQILYVLCAFLILNKFSIKNLFYNLKNMFPAMLSGFTTMSSAASMPLTILGIQSNSKNNRDFTTATVPITINIHLIGDCIAIPILAYAVLKGFGLPEPTTIQYLTFSIYFVLAKFSVAAIPGGGILVMLPILEKYFGFNAEMLSLITALYILFDPMITSINILGNGAFAKLIDNLSGKKKMPANDYEAQF